MTTSSDGFDAVIEEILDGTRTPVSAPTEAAWLSAWGTLDTRQPSAIATAAAGGALADRLAWVFLAGYQAGLQRCFPEADGEGWVAYAISEDRDGTIHGVSVAMDGSGTRLTGTKTWLAACNLVSRIIVTVGTGPDRRFYVVDRDALGVTTEARNAPRFLPELSQGRVTFSGTRVKADRIITDSRRAAEFAVGEPLHVLTALNANMLSQLRRLEAPSELLGYPLATLQALYAVSMFDLTSRNTTIALAGIEPITRKSADLFERFLEKRDPALLGRWRRDRRLVGMFEGGIRRRADELTNRG
ncbi:MAG: hypothetical protein EXR66_02190 [Dehalococcoidia bacterium]|nr:hypothetical protein [Dehalococcoidia bacterium]